MEKKSIINNFGKSFEGPLIIRPEVFEDQRGFFKKAGTKLLLIN